MFIEMMEKTKKQKNSDKTRGGGHLQETSPAQRFNGRLLMADEVGRIQRQGGGNKKRGGGINSLSGRLFVSRVFGLLSAVGQMERGGRVEEAARNLPAGSPVWRRRRRAGASNSKGHTSSLAVLT